MPLSPLDLEKHLSALNIPQVGRDVIRNRIANGPVRRSVQGRGLTGRVVSLKNLETRQTESRTLEAPATTWYENTNEVLGFYDQPCLLKTEYVRPGSTRKSSDHYPDHLVIRAHEIALEEWKFEETLRELALSSPGKYVQDAGSVWHDPWAEKAAAALGFVYRIRTEAHLPALLVRNCQLLAPHAGANVADPAAIISYVRDVPGVSIAEILAHIPGATVADVFALIAAELIWVDRERALLTQHDRVALFESAERGRLLQTPIALIPTGAVSFAAETKLFWNRVQWTVANAAPTKITLEDQSGRLRTLNRDAAAELVRTGELTMAGPKIVDRAELLADVTARALELAQCRFQALQPYITSGLVPISRTHRRWLAAYTEARISRGDGLLGLLPRHVATQARKADARAIEIAHEVITQVVFASARRPYHTGYKIYKERCESATPAVRPVSTTTYRLEIARLTNGRSIRRRMGRKIANALAGARPMNNFPVDGDRAFERVHVDHTMLDIVLVDSVNGEELGRPWLTLAIDAFTRRILGYVLTFDSPSFTSVMLLMRDIVARYGRLPATFVVDNGKEFHSTYFQVTAAAFNVSIEYRPPMDPRFGAVIESCFGKLNRDAIHALRGNSTGRKDVRSQDPKHDAAELAIWNLPALDDLLCTYFFEVYDQMRSLAHGLSPRERFDKSIAEAGVSEREALSDDLHFRVMTAPEIDKAVLVTRQGVKAKRARYSCDAFEREGVRDTRVPVRWEPFNRGIAYAFVEGEWHVCRATHFALLADRTERELHLASTELTARLKRTPSTRELAQHLEAALKTEEALLARQKALEAQRASGSFTALAPVVSDRTAHPVALSQNPPRKLKEWKKSA